MEAYKNVCAPCAAAAALIAISVVGAGWLVRACVSGFVSGTHAIFQVYLLLDLTITFYFTTFLIVFRAYFMHTSCLFGLFLTD